jgi:hypothetical protein
VIWEEVGFVQQLFKYSNQQLSNLAESSEEDNVRHGYIDSEDIGGGIRRDVCSSVPYAEASDLCAEPVGRIDASRCGTQI